MIKGKHPHFGLGFPTPPGRNRPVALVRHVRTHSPSSGDGQKSALFLLVDLKGTPNHKSPRLKPQNPKTLFFPDSNCPTNTFFRWLFSSRVCRFLPRADWGNRPSGSIRVQVTGTVRSAVAFGVFVDIGMARDALAPSRFLPENPMAYKQGQDGRRDTWAWGTRLGRREGEGEGGKGGSFFIFPEEGGGWIYFSFFGPRWTDTWRQRLISCTGGCVSKLWPP